MRILPSWLCAWPLMQFKYLKFHEPSCSLQQKLLKLQQKEREERFSEDSC